MGDIENTTTPQGTAVLRLVQPAPLIDPAVDPAFVTDMAQMAALARRGEIVGMAYVVLHPDRQYTVGLLGSAQRDAEKAYAGCGKLAATLLDLV